MRDPAEIRTKKGTSVIIIAARLAFFTYGIFFIFAIVRKIFPATEASAAWFLYLGLMYVVAEYFYATFLTKGIDLTFAFPILFFIYVLHLVSILLEAQEKYPIINRAEHFAVFVLMTYVVWIFFLQYLPHNVWHDHPYYTAILVFSVVAAAGVMNEIIELMFDTIFGTNLIGKNHLDTSLDLLMNTLGSTALLAAQLMPGLVLRHKK